MPHPVFGWTGIAYNKDTQFFGYLFIAKYVSGDVVLSPEHTDYKWVNRQDAENLDIHQDFKYINLRFLCYNARIIKEILCRKSIQIKFSKN